MNENENENEIKELWFIYLVEQFEWTGYDTFDSMVVVARNETEAVSIHPLGMPIEERDKSDYYRDWPKHSYNCDATKIGMANIENTYTKPTVIIASFNAG